MKITLLQQLAELVKQKVERGPVESPQEVIAEALKLLDERDKKLAALRRDIQEGLQSGPGRPFDEGIVDDIKKRGRERLAH
jgi:antitoxin ParD1/3/4